MRVRLRRGFWARARAVGCLEFFSIATIGLVGFLVEETARGEVGGWTGSDVLLGLLVLTPPIAVRVAVATEYLVADETTVRWRSLFRPRWTTWDHIESIATGKMSLFPTHGDDVINLRFHTGAVRRVRASVGCGAQARRDWVAQTALLFMASGIPPEDRLDPEVAEVVERVLGGRRVGRIVRHRRAEGS